VDRAGIVGEDGATHRGAFDISYLLNIPNMIVSAPKDEDELQHLLYSAINARRPMAVRYPRGHSEGVGLLSDFKTLPLGQAELLREGSQLAILALGSMVFPAFNAAKLLEEQGVSCAVVNARFAKPLDAELILKLAGETHRILTVEENTVAGGFGSAVLELLSRSGQESTQIGCIGLPDKFIEHGRQDLLRAKFDLDSMGIARRVKNFLLTNPPVLSI